MAQQGPCHGRRNRPEAIHEKMQNWGLGCSIALESKGANLRSHWSGSCRDYLLRVAQPGTAPFLLSWLLTQHLKTPAKKSREKEKGRRFPILQSRTMAAIIMLPPLSGLTSRKGKKDQKQAEIKRIEILKFFCFATGCHPSSTYRSARQEHSAKRREIALKVQKFAPPEI